MRLALIVPTEEGGAALVRLSPLPVGATSILSVRGDFRPLAGSKRCADLTAGNGPVSRVSNISPGPHDFGFDHPPGTGRAWEAAVVVGLEATRLRIATIVPPEEAEVVLVACGSVDADLRLGNDGLSVPERCSVDRYSELLADRSRRVVRLVKSAAAGARAQALGVDGPEQILCLDEMSIRRVLEDGSAGTGRSDLPLPAAPMVAAAIVAAAVGLAAFLLSRPTPEAVAERSLVVAVPAGPRDGFVAPDPAQPTQTAMLDRPSGSATKDEDPFRLRLLTAPAGRRCEEVIFGAAEPVRDDVRAVEALLDLTGRDETCGLEIAPRRPNSELGLQAPPGVRIGTIDRFAETKDGATSVWTRVWFGQGFRRSEGFDIQSFDSDGAIAATLKVRAKRR